jgi:hypothetical protein
MAFYSIFSNLLKVDLVVVVEVVKMAALVVVFQEVR